VTDLGQEGAWVPEATSVARRVAALRGAGVARAVVFAAQPQYSTVGGAR